MARRGLRVISISRPGYLRTPLLTGLTAQDQADAIDSLLESLHVNSCAVLAVSEGTPCAIQLSIRHPGRVSSLVLISPVAESLGYTPIASVGYQLFHNLTGDLGCWLMMLRIRLDPRSVFAEMMGVGSSLKPSSCNALAVEAMTSPNQRIFLTELANSITPLSPREAGIINDNAQLKDIPVIPKDSVKAPTLILIGEHDIHSPYESVLGLASHIPHVRLMTIEQAGYILPIGTKSAQNWETVADFMRFPTHSSITRSKRN
jgi:pimeloyl-ACP methyl ester carboxylesterase